MCDWGTRKLVEQVVDDKCRRRIPFTAFDVSLEAKKRGSPERHRDMRHVVHRYFDSGEMGAEYKRRLIAIPGAADKAWLYFHYEDGPDGYQPLDRAAFPRKRRRGPAPDGSYQVDRRMRICVPAELLRRAGLRPGQGVALVADTDDRCLLVTDPHRRAPADRVVASYRVDKHGNVRIVQGTLKKASLGGIVYDMDADAGKVKVRLHQT